VHGFALLYSDLSPFERGALNLNESISKTHSNKNVLSGAIYILLALKYACAYKSMRSGWPKMQKTSQNITWHMFIEVSTADLVQTYIAPNGISSYFVQFSSHVHQGNLHEHSYILMLNVNMLRTGTKEGPGGRDVARH
jgi:hypothetical protein